MRFRFIGWLLGATLLCGQPRTEDAGLYEIQGRVLDADTGAGVPRARVSLTVARTGDQSGQQPEPIVLMTDPAGTFRVSNIPAGFANLSCERTGYFGPDFPHAATASIGLANQKDNTVPVTLYLSRHAAFGGTALDEEARGLGGIVQAYRLALVDGRRIPQPASSSGVDAEGTFRISGLKPGRYYVACFPNFRPGRNRVYRPVIYPGSPDLAGAQVIDVASGDDRQIDFRPASEPAYEISGKMPSEGENSSISVHPVLGAGLSNPWQVGSISRNNEEHTFRASGLPSGQYVITSQWMADGVWVRASKRIAINAGNVGDVILDARASDALPVAVHYDPPADPQPRTSLQLFSGPGPVSSIQDNGGNQSFSSLSPGIYAVHAVGNVYVKSARQGGRDALSEGVLVSEEGASEPLDVTIGNRSASFETTLDPGGEKVEGLVNVAFLRQTALGLHLEQQTSIQARNDRAGFERNGFRPMPTPGEYVVIAWTGRNTPNQLPYNEPGFLDRYASFIEHATLGETGKQTVVIHHLLPASAFEDF